MKEQTNKSVLILIIVVFVVLIIVVAGLVLFILNLTNTKVSETKNNNTSEPPPIVNSEKDTLITEFSLDSELKRATNKNLNYNFAINLPNTGIKDELITIALADETKKISTANTVAVDKIVIPVLGVNAPIIHGIDGDAAIDKGWWLYPASKEQGEKIVLAHRRYWLPGHPYSAWNINTLANGSEIFINDKDGIQYKYKVVAQSINLGSDLSIFIPSDEDILKIITCSTFSGSAGSASHRFVTIAKRV